MGRTKAAAPEAAQQAEKSHKKPVQSHGEGDRAEGRAMRGMAKQEWGSPFKSALHALPLRGCTIWDTKAQVNMERKFHQPRLMGSA